MGDVTAGYYLQATEYHDVTPVAVVKVAAQCEFCRTRMLYIWKFYGRKWEWAEAVFWKMAQPLLSDM